MKLVKDPRYSIEWLQQRNAAFHKSCNEQWARNYKSHHGGRTATVDLIGAENVPAVPRLPVLAPSLYEGSPWKPGGPVFAPIANVSSISPQDAGVKPDMIISSRSGKLRFTGPEARAHEADTTSTHVKRPDHVGDRLGFYAAIHPSEVEKLARTDQGRMQMAQAQSHAQRLAGHLGTAGGKFQDVMDRANRPSHRTDGRDERDQ